MEMITMKTLAMIAVAVALAGCTNSAAQVEMKYPNWFAFEQAALEHPGPMSGEPYFRCDYTTQKCLKGYALGGAGVDIFVGVVLDARDRKTVLGHYKCLDNFRWCNDYDRGVNWKGNVVLKPDMPRACAELMQATGMYDSRREPCKGFGFDFE